MRRLGLIRNVREEKGLALVETAIVLLLLILTTFGVMEYSWMFQRMQQVTNCARAGARQAVLPDSTAGDVQTVVETLAANFGITGLTHVIAPGDITILESGDLITVTVQVPYANVELMGMSIFPVPGTLTSSVTMAKESP